MKVVIHSRTTFLVAGRSSFSRRRPSSWQEGHLSPADDLPRDRKVIFHSPTTFLATERSSFTRRRPSSRQEGHLSLADDLPRGRKVILLSPTTFLATGRSSFSRRRPSSRQKGHLSLAGELPRGWLIRPAQSTAISLPCRGAGIRHGFCLFLKSLCLFLFCDLPADFPQGP